MTDERRVEVAAEALRWTSHGIRYGDDDAMQCMCGWSADGKPDRGDLHREHVARAVVAALDAHDGDMRERLAGAVEHRRTGPGRCACGYDAYKVGAFFPDYHAMLTDHLNAAARTARGTT